jgi:hypothetical protein
MKSITKLLFAALTLTLFNFSIQASDALSTITETKEVERSSKPSKRRKKVEMCNECGKPETKCECEGHGDEEGKNGEKK